MVEEPTPNSPTNQNQPIRKDEPPKVVDPSQEELQKVREQNFELGFTDTMTEAMKKDWLDKQRKVLQDEVPKELKPKQPTLWERFLLRANELFSLYKWVITIVLMLGALAIAVGLVYRFFFAQVFFTVKVVDKNTGNVLPGVAVDITNQQKYTDQTGKARYDTLKPGSNQVLVSLEGYIEVEKEVNLKRGNNSELVVELDLDLIKITGTIYDYVDKRPIKNTTVTIKSHSVESDNDGIFTFENNLPGKQTLVFTKQGYLKRDGNFWHDRYPAG